MSIIFDLRYIIPVYKVPPTFIMFHGNAGNIGHRLGNAYLLYSHTGGNIFLLEYRGYGKSEGTPSERGKRFCFSH